MIFLEQKYLQFYGLKYFIFLIGQKIRCIIIKDLNQKYIVIINYMEEKWWQDQVERYIYEKVFVNVDISIYYQINLFRLLYRKDIKCINCFFSEMCIL